MSEQRRYAQIRKRKWSVLMEKSFEEVADELLKFAKEEYPELVKRKIRPALIDLFWA